jgi:hypothetical protein
MNNPDFDRKPTETGLAEDPSFDLRKGLVILVVVVAVVAAITILCFWIARP